MKTTCVARGGKLIDLKTKKPVYIGADKPSIQNGIVFLVQGDGKETDKEIRFEKAKTTAKPMLRFRCHLVLDTKGQFPLAGNFLFATLADDDSRYLVKLEAGDTKEGAKAVGLIQKLVSEAWKSNRSCWGDKAKSLLEVTGTLWNAGYDERITYIVPEEWKWIQKKNG